MYVRLAFLWIVRAGLKIKPEASILKDLERKFSWVGIGLASGKQVVTGKHKGSVEVEQTNLEMRASTRAAKEEAMKNPAPESQAGKKKSGCKTKKSMEGEAMREQLYDIGLPDSEQPAGKLEFLQNQMGLRTSFLPPIIGELGVESRRRKRELEEEKRKSKEQADAATRFQTAGRVLLGKTRQQPQ